MEYFIATGNLKSQTGLDLMQVSGYTIIAEKLNNMRFLAHFRSVHRGSFFSEMKTPLKATVKIDRTSLMEDHDFGRFTS